MFEFYPGRGIMVQRTKLVALLLTMTCCLMSCATVSKRMPDELDRMHNFLTQEDPTLCQRYQYNLEQQLPRLHSEHQLDSILDVIDYVKTECGPTANLDVTKMLLLADLGHFDDSLIGFATVPQMLWHRSELEFLLRRRMYTNLYRAPEPIDQTHDNYNQFRSDLALRMSVNAEASATEQTIGQFYCGKFDSAFASIQSDQMRGTKLRRSYDDYVGRTKRMFPDRGNLGILVGKWSPRGNNSFLGDHPAIGVQLGWEGNLWRADMIVDYRFSSANKKYQVDSLGEIVSTDKFNSWLFGLEAGVKLFDQSDFSTDLFVGLGYDVIYSVKKAGDPEEHVSHGSIGASIGLRQRVFINQRTGLYVGGIVRYSFVDYANPGGTDLSGNTLTISFVTGWSFNETLQQFLRKLNYKGNWRR